MTTLQMKLNEMYHAETDEGKRRVLHNARIKLQCFEQIIACHEELDDKMSDAAELIGVIDDEMDCLGMEQA